MITDDLLKSQKIVPIKKNRSSTIPQNAKITDSQKHPPLLGAL